MNISSTIGFGIGSLAVGIKEVTASLTAGMQVANLTKGIALIGGDAFHAAAASRIVNNVQAAFSTLATNTTAIVVETYTSATVLAVTAGMSAFFIINHAAPMHMPFLFADKRSFQDMQKTDPEQAYVLESLERRTREQARKMGAAWADKINVRFGLTNESYGTRWSVGGPLLLVSKQEAKEMVLADGSLTDNGKRIIGHELTHIIEGHALYGTASRVATVALLVGLIFATVINMPIITIPVVSWIVYKTTIFVVARVSAQLLGIITSPVNNYFEHRADLGAVRRIPDREEAIKIAQAGQAYFRQKAEKNLAWRNQALAEGGLKAAYAQLTTNAKGERRLDWVHPGYMSRVETFRREELRLLST